MVGPNGSNKKFKGIKLGLGPKQRDVYDVTIAGNLDMTKIRAGIYMENHQTGNQDKTPEITPINLQSMPPRQKRQLQIVHSIPNN